MRTVLRMHAVLSAIRERFHEHCYDFVAAGNRAMPPLSLLGHDTAPLVRDSGAVLLYMPPKAQGGTVL